MEAGEIEPLRKNASPDAILKGLPALVESVGQSFTGAAPGKKVLKNRDA
jgi:hypothetical protein